MISKNTGISQQKTSVAGGRHRRARVDAGYGVKVNLQAQPAREVTI